MSTPVRDHQKSQVYAAEQVLRAIYDNGAQTPVTLRGVTLQLEPEDRFTSLADVQIYLDRVTSHPEVIEALGHRGRITVRERRGDRFAHYQYRDQVIAINTSNTGWGLRELVALHEIAHAFVPGGKHGPEFVATFVTLVGIIIGPQAALALRLLLDE